MSAATSQALPINRATLSDEVASWLVRMTPTETETEARFAVTLTLDVDAMHRAMRTGIAEKQKQIEFARSSFAEFRWKLDRLILKNAAVKYGRELAYIPVLEGLGNAARIHYHSVIVVPARVTCEAMKHSVREAWGRARFGHQQVDVQPLRDEGWLHYMSKEAWTLRHDAVDIDNVRLSTDPKRC